MGRFVLRIRILRRLYANSGTEVPGLVRLTVRMAFGCSGTKTMLSARQCARHRIDQITNCGNLQQQWLSLRIFRFCVALHFTPLSFTSLLLSGLNPPIQDRTILIASTTRFPRIVPSSIHGAIQAIAKASTLRMTRATPG